MHSILKSGLPHLCHTLFGVCEGKEALIVFFVCVNEHFKDANSNLRFCFEGAGFDLGLVTSKLT